MECDRFMHTVGKRILEGGVKEKIDHLLQVASRVTVFAEYIRGTEDDPIKLLGSFPAFQIHIGMRFSGEMIEGVPIARLSSEEVRTHFHIKGGGYGNGFIVEHKGHNWMVTNRHVAEPTVSIQEIAEGGHFVVPASWFFSPRGADIAVCRVEKVPEGIPILTLADKEGEHPYGFTTSINPNDLSSEDGTMVHGAYSMPFTHEFISYLLDRRYQSKDEWNDITTVPLPYRNAADDKSTYFHILPPGMNELTVGNDLIVAGKGTSGSPKLSVVVAEDGTKKVVVSGINFAGGVVTTGRVTYDLGMGHYHGLIEETIDHAMAKISKST